MDRSDVVIIGGVACGPKTGAVLARRRPNLKITLFQKDELTSYATCGMPYYASGDVNSVDDLIKTSYGVLRDAEYFRTTKGFTVVTGSEVVGIQRDKKYVIVKDMKTGETVEETRKLARQGLSMEAIAELRGLSEGTISQHIEKLLEEGQGDGLDIDQLIEPAKRLQVEELFNRHPGASMKTIIEASGETVTYAELRVVRAFMQVEGRE